MASASDGKITKQLLKTRSGEFDIESIHSLVLRGMGLGDLGPIGECSVLERLDLSQNDLSRLHALASLTSLNYLNLSANRISSLEGLQTLDNLTSLNLSGNLIGSIDTLRCLSSLEKLKELRLQDGIKGLSNPVCMNTSYKVDVRKILPDLTVLDGERLSGKGSELYAMCEEIDKLLAARSKEGSSGQDLPQPGPWVPEDFWQRKMVESFDNSALADAQKELENLLADCSRVTKDADEKIKKFRDSITSESSAASS